jgi:hypothetical protein
MQVRNRDAGRIGHVYLQYDRVCGRYYDVDTESNKKLCPIRPLFETNVNAPISEQDVLDMQSDESFQSLLSPSGEEIRSNQDHGGMQ